MKDKIDYNVQKDWDYLINHFNSEYVANMENKAEYVEGHGRNNKSFCYLVEVALKSLGEIRGANSSKFGLWYGTKGKDKTRKYRATKQNFNEDPEVAFSLIKQSLSTLIKEAEKLTEFRNLPFIINGMFKNKIIYLYNKEIMIPSFVEEDLQYFEKNLGLTPSNSFEESQKQLLQYKKDNKPNMTNHEFGCYLYKTFGKHNEKEIQVLNEIHDQKLNKSLMNKRDPKDKYVTKKCPRVEVKTKNKKAACYPRDPKMALYALANANHKCENIINHPLFLKKSNGKPYTEVHHLIPLCFYEDFDVSLDVPENIISLCSNCHNEIHYGINQNYIITKLYNERKEKLELAGIYITLDRLLEMYDFINKHNK